MKLAFLGLGNMTQAMARGLVESKLLSNENILCANERNPEALKIKCEKMGLRFIRANALKEADAVVFAMKPQDFAAAAAMYRPYLGEKQLVISIMAGISFRAMEHALGMRPTVRTMPNMALSVRRSVTGMAANAHCTEDHIQLAETIFTALGMVVKVSEKDISKVIGVAGSSPAYFCLMLEALANAAVEDGVMRVDAERMARETFIGVGEILKTQPISPAELRKRISSKGGTTADAIDALHENGLFEAVHAAYTTARDKSDLMSAKFESSSD